LAAIGIAPFLYLRDCPQVVVIAEGCGDTLMQSAGDGALGWLLPPIKNPVWYCNIRDC